MEGGFWEDEDLAHWATKESRLLSIECTLVTSLNPLKNDLETLSDYIHYE